jgi:hypothetical protein
MATPRAPQVASMQQPARRSQGQGQGRLDKFENPELSLDGSRR